MYTQRIIHFPAVGKGAELRAALEERNASGNAQAPHALSVLMFSPEPAYIHAIRFENLAAIEAYQSRPLDDAFRAQGRKIDQCLARERATVLYEELVGSPPTTAPKFLVRNRYCPAAGKGPELRAVLEERIKRGAPSVAGAGLAQQAFSADGPAFAVTVLFGSMADIDLFRAANAKDESFRPFLTKVASLSRAPVQQRLQRVLAPFPT